MSRLRRVVVMPLMLASLAGLLAFGAHTLVDDGGAVSSFFDRQVYYGLLFAALALCALRAATKRCSSGCVDAPGCGRRVLDRRRRVLDARRARRRGRAALSLAFGRRLPRLLPAGLRRLVLLLHGRLRASRAVWLDGLTAALAVGTLVAAVLLDAVLDSTGGSTAAVVTNLAYPAGRHHSARAARRRAGDRADRDRACAAAARRRADDRRRRRRHLRLPGGRRIVRRRHVSRCALASFHALPRVRRVERRTTRRAPPAVPARALLLVPLACGAAAVATVVAATHYEGRIGRGGPRGGDDGRGAHPAVRHAPRKPARCSSSRQTEAVTGSADRARQPAQAAARPRPCVRDPQRRPDLAAGALRPRRLQAVQRLIRPPGR